MRIRNFIVLLAVAMTFALVGYLMSTQTSNSVRETKLEPADTSLTSLTASNVQPDWKRFLQAVNTSVAEIAEERVSADIPLGLESKLAEMTASTLGAKAVDTVKLRSNIPAEKGKLVESMRAKRRSNVPVDKGKSVEGMEKTQHSDAPVEKAEPAVKKRRKDAFVDKGKSVEGMEKTPHRDALVKKAKPVSKRWTKTAVELLSPSRKIELEMETRKYYEIGESAEDIETLLKETHDGLPHGENQYVRGLIAMLYAETIDNAKTTVDECLRAGLSRDDAMIMVKSYRQKFRVGEHEYAARYYDEQLDKLTKKEVAELLEKGLTDVEILEEMMLRYDEIANEKMYSIKRIYGLLKMDKQVEAIRERIEHDLVLGRTRDQILEKLQADPQWKKDQLMLVDICIEQYHNKKDDELLDFLQKWMKMGESSGIFRQVHKAFLVKDRKNLFTLNMFNLEIPADERNSVKDAFTKALQESLHPRDVRKRHPQSNHPLTKYLELYEKFYKTAEINLLRKLMTLWETNVKPENVEAELKESFALYGEKMILPFSNMYARMWEKNSQALVQ